MPWDTGPWGPLEGGETHPLFCPGHVDTSQRLEITCRALQTLEHGTSDTRRVEVPQAPVPAARTWPASAGSRRASPEAAAVTRGLVHTCCHHLDIPNGLKRDPTGSVCMGPQTCKPPLAVSDPGAHASGTPSARPATSHGQRLIGSVEKHWPPSGPGPVAQPCCQGLGGS